MAKLIVKSQHDGYRRAGLAFTREGITVDTTKLTEEQVKAIKDDPRLLVAEVVEPKKAEAKTDPAAGKDGK